MRAMLRGVPVLLSLLFLVACGPRPAGENPVSTAPTEHTPTETAPAKSPSVSEEIESMPESPPPIHSPSVPQEEVEEIIDYKTPYLQVLEQCQAQAREAEKAGEWVPPLYAALLETGSDVPALACAYGRDLYLYTVDTGGLKILLEAKAGGDYGHTDVSWTLRFPKLDGKDYVVLSHTENEWTEDRWTAYTVEGETLIGQTFLAQTDGQNDAPTVEELVRFQIDGKNVTREAYLAARAQFWDQAAFSYDVAYVTQAELQPYVDSVFAALQS